MAKKPSKVNVEEKLEISKVKFLGNQTKDAWQARYKVEMKGMEAATEYYSSKGIMW